MILVTGATGNVGAELVNALIYAGEQVRAFDSVVRGRDHRPDLARPGRRDVLRVHPRGNVRNPEQGVFNTRSPHRPNPIGLHRVKVIRIDGLRFLVRNLAAVDGTPIVDVKPVLTEGPESRR